MIKVLVAEDDGNVAAFIKRAVSSRGWVAEIASDAHQVVRALRADVWDLILLDLMMPGADGLDLLERIRAAVPDQPVIVVSASSDSATKVAALSAGAADYLCKPFSVDELLARSEVRMRQSDDRRYLRRGRVSVDLGRRHAYVDNREIRLTEREFDLLVALMESPDAGQPVRSREELLSTVWGYTFDPGSNVVDVYIRRLRAKLGVGTIETVRSIGYAFAGA